MIPLMLVSALSYTVVRRFEPINIELRKLKKIGKRKEQVDQKIVSRLKISRMMETNYNPVSPDMSVKAFIKILAVSPHNTFPVVGSEGEFLGIIVFSKVKELIFNASGEETTSMYQLMSKPKATIQVDETPHSIIEKFEQTLSFRLPVLDGKQYLGFITKAVLLGEYRKEILGGDLVE